MLLPGVNGERSHLTTCDMIMSSKTDVNTRVKLGISYNKWSGFKGFTDMRKNVTQLPS